MAMLVIKPDGKHFFAKKDEFFSSRCMENTMGIFIGIFMVI
jgi:hypothetical protein